MPDSTEPPALAIRVVETASVRDVDVARVKAAFAENYREANLAYLEKSLGKLAYLAMAETEDGTLAGFALGEMRIVDLPRLPGTAVRLAGLCCVSMAFRRQHLFGKLEVAAISARDVGQHERLLSAGRMAHPGSFRGMASNPTAVPRSGVPLTPWQKEVGIAVAEAYGTAVFDPETFVCHGTGVPIGFPVIDLQTTEEEWEVFKPVDRLKGDSLLGIAWAPTAPEGWLE